MRLGVALWARGEEAAVLADYEDRVLAILAGHGGKVVRRVRAREPAEIQLLDLPSERALASFMTDPRRLALAGLRDRTVAATTLVRLRTAQATDREALRDLHLRASYIWPEDRVHLDANPGIFGVPDGAIEAGATRVACDDDGRIVGFATVLAGDPDVLEDLFVEPDRMRAGIGRILVEDAASGTDRPITVIAHERTRRFYERAGFTLDGPAQTRFGPALRFTRR